MTKSESREKKFTDKDENLKIVEKHESIEFKFNAYANKTDKLLMTSFIMTKWQAACIAALLKSFLKCYLKDSFVARFMKTNTFIVNEYICTLDDTSKRNGYVKILKVKMYSEQDSVAIGVYKKKDIDLVDDSYDDDRDSYSKSQCISKEELLGGYYFGLTTPTRRSQLSSFIRFLETLNK